MKEHGESNPRTIIKVFINDLTTDSGRKHAQELIEREKTTAEIAAREAAAKGLVHFTADNLVLAALPEDEEIAILSQAYFMQAER
jgi:hypothetical protein